MPGQWVIGVLPVRSPWLVHLIFTRTSPPVITHKKRLIVEAVFFNMSVGNSKSAFGHKMVLGDTDCSNVSVLQAQGTRKRSGSEQDWLGIIIIQESKTGQHLRFEAQSGGSTSSYRYNFPTNQNRPSLHPPFD